MSMPSRLSGDFGSAVLYDPLLEREGNVWLERLKLQEPEPPVRLDQSYSGPDLWKLKTANTASVVRCVQQLRSLAIESRQSPQCLGV
jgi:hypothetical protein